jgi:hypothetical protein
MISSLAFDWSCVCVAAAAGCASPFFPPPLTPEEEEKIASAQLVVYHANPHRQQRQQREEPPSRRRRAAAARSSSEVRGNSPGYDISFILTDTAVVVVRLTNQQTQMVLLRFVVGGHRFFNRHGFRL